MVPDFERNTYEAVVYYYADNDESANQLYDDMLGGLGCPNDGNPEHECPHFALGFGPLLVADTRRAAWRQLRMVMGSALHLLVTGRHG